MSFDAHGLFSYTTVKTPPSPSTSGTSLTVATGTGAVFPTPPFNCTVCPEGVMPLAYSVAGSNAAEIIRVTAVVGDVLTIVRAQEGSTARAIGVGDQIFNAITPKTLTDVETAVTNAAPVFNVKAYGAVGDGKRVTDGVMTSGSAVLTSATGLFTAGDVGKNITVLGAATNSGGQIITPLITTIASYQSATQVTLTAAATASTSSTGVAQAGTTTWGTDDGPAFIAAVTAANAAGGGIVMAVGKFAIGACVSANVSNVTISGAGQGATTLYAVADNAMIQLEPGSSVSVFNNCIRYLTLDASFTTTTLCLRNNINSLVDNVTFANSNGKYQLLLGSLDNGAGYWGNTQSVRNCLFSTSLQSSTESINMGQGRNIEVSGCVFDTGYSGAIYTWFAEDVRISGCEFNNRMPLAIGGRGPTTVTNCTFIDSYITLTAQNVTIASNTFRVTVDSGSNLADIILVGNYNQIGEAAWYSTYGPFLCDNVVIAGNTFSKVASNGIRTTSYFTDPYGNKYPSVDSLSVVGNVFSGTRWQPEVMAKTLLWSDNIMSNQVIGGGANTAGAILGGNTVTVIGNIAQDDQTLTPPGAPTVAISGTAGNPNGTYIYRITFVTAAGETIGGTISATISPASKQVNLTNIPLGPSGVTARKIYRTAAGGADGSQKLVTTLSDNTTTAYTDNVADGSLTTAVPTVNTVPAKTQIVGVTLRNELEEAGISSGMTVSLANNQLQGSVNYYYSSGFHSTPSGTMTIQTLPANPNIGAATATSLGFGTSTGDIKLALYDGGTENTQSGIGVQGGELRFQTYGTPGQAFNFYGNDTGTPNLVFSIASSGLISFAKTTGVGGAWTQITPTLTSSGTTPNIGSTGTITGYYVQVGKTVTYCFSINVAGSGIANGTGNYFLSLPVTAKYRFAGMPLGQATHAIASSSLWAQFTPYAASSGTIGFTVWGVNNSATSPVVNSLTGSTAVLWSAGTYGLNASDSTYGQITYEAA